MSDNFDEEEIEEQDDLDLEQEETAPTGGQDVVGLLKRMQQQLSFLEKKIDTLLSQSSQGGGSDRPRFNSDRRFSRPSRPFGNSYGGSDRGAPRDRAPRDRGDFAPRGRGGFDRPRREDSRGGSGGGFNRGNKKKFFRGDRA